MRLVGVLTVHRIGGTWVPSAAASGSAAVAVPAPLPTDRFRKDTLAVEANIMSDWWGLCVAVVKWTTMSMSHWTSSSPHKFCALLSDSAAVVNQALADFSLAWTLVTDLER